MHMHAWGGCIHPGVHMWRPEVGVESSITIYVFEMGLSLNQEVINWLNWPESYRDLPISYPSSPALRLQAGKCPDIRFYIWVLGIISGSSLLVQQALHSLSQLLSAIPFLFNEYYKSCSRSHH